MASIILTTLWLTNWAEVTDSEDLPLLSALKVTPTTNGAVRRYANGRLRAVAQAGSQRQMAATLPSCDVDDVDWIETHVGQVLLIRDDRGRRFWGIYYTFDAAEHQYNDETDVNLTLNEVSVVEGV